MSVLSRAGFRHWRRQPFELALSLLGVAMGVALVVGVSLAQASVRRAFAWSRAAVSGRATHTVRGGPTGLPLGTLARLRVEGGVRSASPRLEAFVVLSRSAGQAPQETVRLVGVDPFVDAGAAPAALRAAAGAALPSLLVGTGNPPRPAVLLPAPLAARLAVAPGDTLALRLGAHQSTVRVAGVFPIGESLAEQASAGVVVGDLAAVDTLLRESGEARGLDGIDLEVPAGAEGERLVARVRALLPPGTQLEDAAQGQRNLTALAGAFDLNLLALSLLSVLVGAFLVYNAAMLSLVRRRHQIAVLRTLGVARGEIFRLLWGEAAAMGLLGSALGLLIGTALARGLVRLVARAVNDLYFAVDVRGVALAPGPLLAGLAIGVAAAVLAATPAAFEATQAPPQVGFARSAFERAARARALRWLRAGVGLGVMAAALLLWPSRSLPVAFAGLFALVTGAAALAPAIVLVVSTGLARLLARGALATRLAVRNVAASLSRTGLAAAALMAALSVSVGVGIMVSSLRASVITWLANTLVADVYVSGPELVASRTETSLPHDLPERLRRLPAVAGLSTYRATFVDAQPARVYLIALALDPRGRRAFELLAGSREAAFAAFDAGEAVFVSEPYAYRYGLHVGDEVAVVVPTTAGRHTFRVAAVYRDYGRDSGTMMIARPAYDRLFADPAVTSLALFAAPGVDDDALTAAAQAVLRPDEVVLVRPTRALRQMTLQVFDRTFAVTSVLRVLTLAIALLGIIGALLSLSLERARELGVLRALGLTPRQVRRLVLTETTFLGACAGVMAAPLGVLLATVLVHVINRRSFGWGLSLQVTATDLLLAPLAGAGAGFVAGLWPAARAARVSPAEALRAE